MLSIKKKKIMPLLFISSQGFWREIMAKLLNIPCWNTLFLWYSKNAPKSKLLCEWIRRQRYLTQLLTSSHFPILFSALIKSTLLLSRKIIGSLGYSVPDMRWIVFIYEAEWREKYLGDDTLILNCSYKGEHWDPLEFNPNP